MPTGLCSPEGADDLVRVSQFNSLLLQTGSRGLPLRLGAIGDLSRDAPACDVAPPCRRAAGESIDRQHRSGGIRPLNHPVEPTDSAAACQKEPASYAGPPRGET